MNLYELTLREKFRYRWWPRIFEFFGGGGGSSFLGLAGVYFAAYEYLQKWSFFSEFEAEHKRVVFCLLIFSVFIIIIQWRHKKEIQKEQGSSENILTEFVNMVSTVVTKKTDSLVDRLPQIAKRKSLKNVIHPDEQIREIIGRSSDFLKRVFSLEEPNLDITIAEQDHRTGKWKFIHQLNSSWKHGDPENFCKEGFTSKTCLDSGQHIFHPSKSEAADKNTYTKSERDEKSHGDGSIFCQPAIFEFSESKRRFVISIVTYGKRLCDPWDGDTVSKVDSILREITRRLELELILNTIKNYEKNHNREESKAASHGQHDDPN